MSKNVTPEFLPINEAVTLNEIILNLNFEL